MGASASVYQHGNFTGKEHSTEVIRSFDHWRIAMGFDSFDSMFAHYTHVAKLQNGVASMLMMQDFNDWRDANES